MKPGDLVVLLLCQVGSEAWKLGLRAGAIGKVQEFQPCSCGCPLDTFVHFDCIATQVYVWHAWLRKIDPPEAGKWEDCAWQPAKTRA